MSGASVRTLTPKGLSVASRMSCTAVFISSKVSVAAARKPMPPALDVAAVSRAVDTQPMPVCTIGTSMPKRSHAGVCNAGCRSGYNAGPVAAHDGTSSWRRPVGSMMSISASSSLVGARDSAHVVGDHELERRGLDDLVDGHARVDRTQPHRVVGRLEVEHAQVRHDPADLVEPVARAPRPRACGHSRGPTPRRRSRRSCGDRGWGPSSWWCG